MRDASRHAVLRRHKAQRAHTRTHCVPSLPPRHPLPRPPTDRAWHRPCSFSGMGACSESTLLLLRLLQIDTSLVMSIDADKRTPLHWACGKNALPCVRALIKSGAAIDALDWAGRTPIHWAVLVDAAESTSELITAGAGKPLKSTPPKTQALALAGTLAPSHGLSRHPSSNH